MFEKREVRHLASRRDEVWNRSWDWWSRQGFVLTQTGPYRFHGSSFYARIGLRREFDLILDEAKDGTSADLTFRAKITEEGLIGGAVAAIVFFPVAVVGGAISYIEYESDSRNVIAAFWQSISGTPSAGGSTAIPPPCKGCGSALLPDWKVCPYCGKPAG